jgi:hypothetical protein
MSIPVSRAKVKPRGADRVSIREAAPPTADDVIVLFDGRRLDTQEKVLAWLEEIEADRAAGRSVLDELP